MMASPLEVAIAALAAALLWTIMGLAVGRHLFSGWGLALATAPALGWAVSNAAALPILLVTGFSFLTVAVITAIACFAALASLGGMSVKGARLHDVLALAALALAAASLALAPAVAILPKLTEHGVLLAGPMFDHSKIAIIDAITRQGLPVVNPILGQTGEATPFAYYYLWHFGAAVISMLTGVSGWEADAAMTWFTGFASLTLMMGLAVRVADRLAAAFWVVPLALAGSLRPVLAWLVGPERLDTLIRPASGFAGWLFQATWSPQHLAAASCLLLVLFLLERLADSPGPRVGAALALVLAAGFQSSIWVGGVTTALVAPAALLVLLARTEAGRRWRLVIAAAVCGLLAVALSAPLLLDQLGSAAARGLGSPIALSGFPVLGTAFPDGIRRALDLPAYWLVLLVVEFPAIYPAGILAFLGSRRQPVLGALILVSLTAGWLLVSTVGDNNDLGWRAVLPGVMALTVLAAAGLACWSWKVPAAATLALTLTVLAMPDSFRVIRDSIAGNRSAISGAVFAEAPELWDAVRRLSSPVDRIANNPLFLRDMTPWPVNISWALLADRPSCYAGNELALAFAPLPPARRAAVEALFTRVFEGKGLPGDVGTLINRHDCHIAVVTPQDGAWNADPFADSPHWRLADTMEKRWRIYIATAFPDGLPVEGGVSRPTRSDPPVPSRSE
jgi:hypothetical protein